MSERLARPAITEPLATGTIDPVNNASGPTETYHNPADAFTGSSDGSGDGDFNDTIHAGRDKRNRDGSYRLKRGRKAGSGGNRTAKGSAPPSVNTIETALVGIHTMLAVGMSEPGIMLDGDESKQLATAVAEVAKHYGDIPGLSDKAMAWIGLAFIAGKVYVPRASMVASKLPKREKKAKPERAPQMPHLNSGKTAEPEQVFIPPDMSMYDIEDGGIN